MARFILQRLWHGFIVICCVTAIVFVVTRIIGDPVALLLPFDSTDAERAAMSAALGFDQPIHVQFFRFLSDVATFNFGDSLWQRRPAMPLILDRLPMTLLLAFAGVGLAVLVSIPLGIAAAVRPGSLVDRLTLLTGVGGLSIPQFWLGILLIIAFGVQLRWLPTSGAQTAWAIILPALTLATRSIARLSAVVRSAMLEELNKPYIRTARAKGLSWFRIVGAHALRNASVPIITLSGWELISTIAGGIIVVETIFAWPGVGLMIVQAIERQDLVLLQAAVFTVAFIAVTINLCVDILHRFLDPRIDLN